MITRIDETKCTGCGICDAVCPVDVLRLDTHREEIPPCQEACPANVNIRGFIYLLRQEDFYSAAKLLRDASPLPAVTGHVCFHSCESGCARKEVDEAVNINSLERFVSDYCFNKETKPLPVLHTAKVAVIGSGPAGISAAYFLTRRGYAVTVFESMPEPGGMLRYGIPDYRLPKDVLDAEIDYINSMGVEFKTNTTFGRDLTVSDLKDSGYKAMVLSIGAQQTRGLNIEGIELNGVLKGLEFLKKVNSGIKSKIGNRVIVVGGGNVAIDVALTSLRLKARKVEMVCLESEREMPAHKEYLQQAADEGIVINYSWGPERILGKDGKVSDIELISCTSVFDKDKFSPSFDKSRTKLIEADTVIFAIGQTTDFSFLPGEFKRAGETISVEPLTLATSLPGVFAAGDCVSGPTSVVEAIASGKEAAVSADLYLIGQDIRANRERSIRKAEKLPTGGIRKAARLTTPVLPVEQRKENFREVKTGFNEDMAMNESQRCMTCGSKAYIAYHENCMSCFNCERECPSESVDVSPLRKIMPFSIPVDFRR